jgi:hypothetical protein
MAKVWGLSKRNADYGPAQRPTFAVIDASTCSRRCLSAGVDWSAE